MAITPLAPVVPEQARARVFKEMLVFGFVLSLFLLYLFIVFSDHGFLALYQAKARYAAVQADLEKARSENTAILARLKGLRDDPKALEGRAREELRMVRPGETLYLFIETPAGTER